MSGHAGFAPIGSNVPPIVPPQVGGVGSVVGGQGGAPDVHQQEQPSVEQPDKSNARSLAQKLDVMLLSAAQASTHSVSADSAVAAAKIASLGEAESAALAKAAKAARKAMKEIAGFSGRQIAAAFIVDGKNFDWNKASPAAKAIQNAIDAQVELSALLTDIANRPEISGKAFEAFSEMAMQCDRRHSEIFSLALQLADAASQAGDDPKLAARLDAKLETLLPRQAMTMHGNTEILDKMKAQLQPLAERLEAFVARPNASLTSEEFLAYSAEVKSASAAIRHALKEGFPTPDGGRLLPDRGFMSALSELTRAAEKQLEDVRKNIGNAVLKQFVTKNIAAPSDLTILAPENARMLAEAAPNLASAVKIRRELAKAAREYIADPTSDEKRQKIDEVMGRYAELDADVIKSDIGKLFSNCRHVMDDNDWRRLQSFFGAETQALKTQIAHLDAMVKSIREKMTPEQFLSTTSASALLRGKIAFSTLVEARIHGMQDADVDPKLDDSNHVSSKVLGAGNVNTVKLVTYKDGTQCVFKPEAIGRQSMENLALSNDYVPDQQVSQLNLATQSTAKALGLDDVMPKCTVGMHDGDYGLFMEKAPGVDAVDFVSGKGVPPGSLSAKDVAKLSADKHAKVVGALIRGTNRLEWLDLVAGQGDRHAHNYMIDVKSDLTVSVKGIDNDQSFPAYRTGVRTYVLKGKHADAFRFVCDTIVNRYPKRLREKARERLLNDPGFKAGEDGTITIDTTKFKAGELHFAARNAVGMHGATLPDFIDEDLFQQLTALKSGEKRDAYLADLAKRLPTEAVYSARNRLDEAIAHAEKLFAEGKVVANGDFEKQDVQKRLLGRELNAENPVKPLNGYKLPTGNGMDPRQDIVFQAKRQNKSLFMRDLIDKTCKKDWFD